MWQIAAAALLLGLALLSETRPTSEPSFAYIEGAMSDPTGGHLDPRDEPPPDHFVLSQGGAIDWVEGPTSYRVELGISDCYGIKKETIMGDYTYTNGSKGLNVQANDVLKDDFDLRLTSGEDFEKAKLSHLIKNGQAAIVEIESAYEHLSASTLSYVTVPHDELRRLLSLGGSPPARRPLAGVLQDIPPELRWFAFTAPRIAYGALTGFIVANAIGYGTSNSTGMQANILEAEFVIAAAALMFPLVRRMENLLPAAPTEPGQARIRGEWHVYATFILTIRCYIRLLREKYKDFALTLSTVDVQTLPFSENEAQPEQPKINLDAFSSKAASLQSGEKLLGENGPLATGPQMAAIETAQETSQQKANCPK